MHKGTEEAAFRTFVEEGRLAIVGGSKGAILVMVVVFNSPPWIFLSKLGIIEQALELFNTVWVPSSAWEEVLRRRDTASAALERLEGLRKIADRLWCVESECCIGETPGLRSGRH